MRNTPTYALDSSLSLSVVIPTLNEAASLAETIGVLHARTAGAPVEVIVADCGSTDGTPSIARRCGAMVERSPSLTNRARACNAGARVATADVLLFLHADTHVPDGYDHMIREALSTPAVVGGAFEFKLDGPQRRLRLVEFVNRCRYRIRGRFFGDQGIFVLRGTFSTVGGFPDEAIFEDAHFCARARRVGLMRLVRARMLTNPRRFHGRGILTMLALDAALAAMDALGWSPVWAARAYARENVERGRSTPRGAANISPSPPLSCGA